jgi:hypothetical protein
MPRDLAGQFAVTEIGGWVGAQVAFGQRMIRPRSPNAARYARRFSHTLIALDDRTVIEAMPGGARITPIEVYTEGPRAHATRWSDILLTPQQKTLISEIGRSMEGRPYSFANYPALGLHHLGMRPDWLVAFIEDSGHVVCSQMTDLVYYLAGIHLFYEDPDRLFMDVIPIDLADWQDRHPQWVPVTTQIGDRYG